MKIPLLPEIDMARIAPQSRDQKYFALEQFRVSFPPYRYVPVRKSLSDILSAQAGFLPSGPRVPFKRIAQMIRAESRTPNEAEANLRVAEGLYGYASARSVVAQTHEFFPLTLGGNAKLTYWHSLVMKDEGRPLVPFVDPRRSTTRLTELGRRFVFSVMHERIRVADPDYGDVRLGIFQFTVPKAGPREPTLHVDDGIGLFSFDQLDEMVRETNEMWTEVFTQRTERKRRGA